MEPERVEIESVFQWFFVIFLELFTKTIFSLQVLLRSEQFSVCADRDIISACAFVWFSVATDENNFPMSHSAYAPIMKKNIFTPIFTRRMNFHEMEANAVREKHKKRFFSFRGRFIYTIDPLPEVSALGKCENFVKNFWSVADTQSSHRSHKSLSHWWRHQIWFICVQTECLRYSKNGFGV